MTVVITSDKIIIIIIIIINYDNCTKLADCATRSVLTNETMHCATCSPLSGVSIKTTAPLAVRWTCCRSPIHAVPADLAAPSPSPTSHCAESDPALRTLPHTSRPVTAACRVSGNYVMDASIDKWRPRLKEWREKRSRTQNLQLVQIVPRTFILLY